MKILRSLLCTFAPALLFSSCQIIGLRQHVEKMESFGIVTVRVSPPPTSAATTYAAAWVSKNGELRAAGVQRVGPNGVASFTLRTDRSYTVGAFTDTNGNQSYDSSEPADYVTDVTALSLGDPDARSKIVKLTLIERHHLPPGTTMAIPKEDAALGSRLNFALGEVVSLNDEDFTTDAGGSGLWRPLTFLSEHRPGIYFTEPYDPARMPVVLVYGIGGTPQDWRYFCDHFDRKRYQVWFLHYPSGMRLERVARAMATGLELLRERYGFTQCDVIAHSMGGLVARRAIEEDEMATGASLVPRFVSISTPWGGHAAASGGIRHLKKPVPSWLDVAPGSQFLAEIYSQPLPHGTRHLLIYGSQPGGPFWLNGENDGVVTVQSEIDPRARKAAAAVVHLPYGHVEILQQDKTLTETLRFLDQK